jgi:hypothetical protein
LLGDRGKNLQTTGAGHLDVAQHQVECAFCQSVKRLPTVSHGHHFVALASKDSGQKFKSRVIVLSDQDPAVRTHVGKTIMEIL